MASHPHALKSEMPVFSDDDRRKNIILSICNFRAYGMGQIKIPMNAVTLINGPSGVGKTTIFEAFVFILYNGVTNPERFKTKGCYGWLFSGDYIIYRQTDTRFLKVFKYPLNANANNQRVEYVQEEAQQIINSLFGNLDIFLSCAYLRQKEFSAFLGSSDADKMAIVKSIALKGAELDEIKEPIKRKVSELQLQFTTVRAQLDMAINTIQQFDHRHPKIVQTAAPENPADVVKKVQELRVHQEGIEAEYKNAIENEAGVKFLKDHIDGMRTRKMQAESKAPKISLEVLRTKLTEIEAKLKEITGAAIDYEKITKAQMFKLWTAEDGRQESAVKIIEKDLEMIASSIKKIFADLPTDGHEAIAFLEKKKIRLEEIKTAQNEIRVMLSQAGITSIDDGKAKLAALEADLTKAKDKESSIRADLDKARMANKMKCPQCQTSVIVAEDGKHLEKCPDSATAPTGFGAMLAQKQEASSPAAGPTISHDDLAKAAGVTASISSRRDRLQSSISEIDLKIKSDPIESADNATAVANLPLYAKFIEGQKNLDIARASRERHRSTKPEEIVEKSVDLTAKSGLENQKAAIERDINLHLEVMRVVESENTNLLRFTEALSQQLSRPGRSSMELERIKADLQSQSDMLLHLNTSSELLAQRGILDKTMREKAELAQKAELMYNAAVRLSMRATEAERASLQSAVDEINAELNKILTKLFAPMPISVEISTTKQLKSKKDQVSQRFDVKIFYNSSEYGSAKQLSGGEKDRLSLAITLAMSQKFGSPFLFLDETLSSLNPELKSVAVSLLKEFSSGRTIVVVSHDETEGLFDHVIRNRPVD